MVRGEEENPVYAYRHLVELEGLTWEEPKCYRESKLPFFPLEKEVDALITFLPLILATLTRTLKETGARIGEAVQITMDVKAERNKITINGIEKHGLPRTIKVSNGLITMIKRY